LTFSLQQSTPARLHHPHVVSDNPGRLAEFYTSQMQMTSVGGTGHDRVVLVGRDRAMEITARSSGQGPHFGYAMRNQEELNALRKRLQNHGLACQALTASLFQPGAFVIGDPQGRRMAFGLEMSDAASVASRDGLPARLQHTVFQTTELERVVTFYTDIVGFSISDEVVDDNGRVAVVFLRSDDEHHSLAFFQGSRNEWDHHCYETDKWNDIRDWGDRFAAIDVPIFFGPGRHGPGNNLFFMVTDPDGNRLEFSAELARVAVGAQPGVWPHGERTLNSWGRAWMRS
jgi:catechol 2,3-dioxygenase-like lactoylglutathione lyase family enzyme